MKTLFIVLGLCTFIQSKVIFAQDPRLDKLSETKNFVTPEGNALPYYEIKEYFNTFISGKKGFEDLTSMVNDQNKDFNDRPTIEDYKNGNKTFFTAVDVFGHSKMNDHKRQAALSLLKKYAPSFIINKPLPSDHAVYYAVIVGQFKVPHQDDSFYKAESFANKKFIETAIFNIYDINTNIENGHIDLKRMIRPLDNEMVIPCGGSIFYYDVDSKKVLAGKSNKEEFSAINAFIKDFELSKLSNGRFGSTNLSMIKNYEGGISSFSYAGFNIQFYIDRTQGFFHFAPVDKKNDLVTVVQFARTQVISSIFSNWLTKTAVGFLENTLVLGNLQVQAKQEIARLIYLLRVGYFK